MSVVVKKGDGTEKEIIRRGGLMVARWIDGGG